jgi:hypothetical protein
MFNLNHITTTIEGLKTLFTREELLLLEQQAIEEFESRQTTAYNQGHVTFDLEEELNDFINKVQHVLWCRPYYVDGYKL